MSKNRESNFNTMTLDARARWYVKLDAGREAREREGQEFKEIYQRLGISQCELARRTNMSASTIAKFEKGQYVRSRKIVRQSLMNAIRLISHEMLVKAMRGLQMDTLH